NNLAGTPAAIPVTFQVDMSVQALQGRFDPTVDTVTVAGDVINNWNATASPLTNSPANMNLWQGTYEVTSTTGNSVLYQFVINGGTWESIDNRVYTLMSENAQTIPKAFFNNVNDLGAITIAVNPSKQLDLTWTAGPSIRLQSASDVKNGPWQEVPNTLGQG